jgi:hypothetical protein
LGFWMQDGGWGMEEYIACVFGGLEFIWWFRGIGYHFTALFFSSRLCRIAGALLFIGGYRYLVF